MKTKYGKLLSQLHHVQYKYLHWEFIYQPNRYVSTFELSVNTPYPAGGGYSVQKTLQGRVANICSKIILLVYEWPHTTEFGIWMGHFFNFFLNLSQNWLKLKKILENLAILLKIWPKIGLIGIWIGHFSWKIRICMGLLSNFETFKPNLSNPHPTPPPGSCSI